MKLRHGGPDLGLRRSMMAPSQWEAVSRLETLNTQVVAALERCLEVLEVCNCTGKSDAVDMARQALREANNGA